MAEPKRLYLDQMFAVDVALALRKAGHDILRASQTDQSRADDLEILNFAIADGRILVTMDEHFGDWVVLPLSRHPGVIRLKVHPATSRDVIDRLVPFLDRYAADGFANHLVILHAAREKWIRTG